MVERAFGAPLPGLPVSSYIRRGDTVYTSGCIDLDYQTGRVAHPNDMAGQTRGALEALRAILEGAGSGLDEIDFMMIFVRDASLFNEMNTVYQEFFPHACPARTTVVSKMVSEDVFVEMHAIANVHEGTQAAERLHGIFLGA